TGERIPGRESWRISISMTLPPFRLPRKLNRWRAPTKYEPVKTIVDVVDEGVSEEQVCIVVDAADSLYVTRGHTLTHNSLFACAGAQELYNRGEIDVVLAFTMMRHKNNLRAFFTDTTKLSAQVIEGTMAKERRQRLYGEGFDVYVLNYTLPKWDFAELSELTAGKRVLWVLDEVQQVLAAETKNESRKAIDTLIKGCRATIWPMTASIVGSNPLRYRSVFALSQERKNPLGTQEEFEGRYLQRDAWGNPKKRVYERHTKAGGTFRVTDYDWDLAALHEVRHRVADRVQNARKGDPGVREFFPPLEVRYERIQMSRHDRELINVVEHLAKEARKAGDLLPVYSMLQRYICNTPEGLLYSSSPVAKFLVNEYPKLVTSHHSAKLEYFLDQVESIAAAGDKCVVFTHWTNLCLFILSRELDKRHIRHVVHYGTGQTAKESQKAQDRFKADPNITLFLSSDAGAYCLNMQEARYCIQYECPYSYDDFQQRINRIHRSDSKLDGLTAYVYVTEDTIEERIAGICEDRRQLAEATLGTSEVVALPEHSRLDESANADFLLFGDGSDFWERIKEKGL
ncbi:C-terminal helicase domain-containing protein, partial [Pseudomonas sp.]|uniref:helicase-related protein n=1 Tax=Pseudomonas sp. TaxID=306 RepID=UPI00260BD21E